MKTIKNTLGILWILLCLLPFTNLSAQEASVAPYQGTIEHLFFHPLIAFPDMAFSAKGADLEFIDSWFNTAEEFKKILPELYDRGFILVDIYDAVDPKTMEKKPLYLPSGKKPLILSVDDLNYYPDTVVLGTNRRLFVDKNNQLMTLGYNSKNKEVISSDLEIVTILESFISKHPDFSHKGARGIIALTGFYGYFGWAIHKPKGANYKTQLTEAKAVADKLKSFGWHFASHSWSHKRPTAITNEVFFDIETQWFNLAKTVIGSTDLYIYPFGLTLTKYPERLEFLKKQGFKFFFGVGDSSLWEKRTGYVYMDRIPVDGRGLRGKFASLAPFFDLKKVIDSQRKGL